MNCIILFSCLKSKCFKCVKTGGMLIIFKATLYVRKTFAKHVSHTSMSERFVSWRSASCDILQDGSVELMRVCKRSAVEKSLETLHSRREGGAVVRKLQATECKGRRNKYFSFKKVFLRPKIIYYSAK